MAGYAGACHRAAPCADPVGLNPSYGLRARAATNSSPRKTSRLSKNSDVRVRKRTEAPAIVSHILVRRVRGGCPQQHLTTVEVGEWFSTPCMRAACASEAPGRKSDCC